MTAAESLRKEMADGCPFSKGEFIEAVCKSIKRNGEFGFTVNNRYESGWSLTNEHHIPSRYLDLVRRWAWEEGFCVIREFTCYGRANYWVTLGN